MDADKINLSVLRTQACNLVRCKIFSVLTTGLNFSELSEFMKRYSALRLECTSLEEASKILANKATGLYSLDELEKSLLTLKDSKSLLYALLSLLENKR